jgi:hypothetical protein
MTDARLVNWMAYTLVLFKAFEALNELERTMSELWPSD